MAYFRKRLRAGRRVRHQHGVSATAQLNGKDSIGAGVDEVDLRQDKFQSTTTAPALDAYDPRPVEDGARRAIAFMLIGILCVLISSMLIMLVLGTIKPSELKEFAVVLGPVITLVSAATGFYYGTKSK